MKKVTTPLMVLAVGSIFVAGTAAALGPFDPSSIPLLVPRAGGTLPSRPGAHPAPVVAPLSAAAKAAAIARIRSANRVPLPGPVSRGLGGYAPPSPSPFTISLGSLLSAPAGAQIIVQGMALMQLMPEGPTAYSGLFLGMNDQVPVGAGFRGWIDMAGLPLGTWLVQCIASPATGSTDFSITVGTAGGTGGSVVQSIPATTSGIVFAAVFSGPAGSTGTVSIDNPTDWWFESCTFDPAQ